MQMAVVAQHNFYSFDFDVMNIVLMGRSSHKKILERDNLEDYQIASQALKIVGMENYEKRSFATLSGGEQRRVILARALTQQIECLILDAPTNHMDVKYQLQIIDIVKGLNTTVVVAIRDLNIVAMYCGCIVAVKSGQVVAVGTPRKLLYDVYDVSSRVCFDNDIQQLSIIYLPQYNHG